MVSLSNVLQMLLSSHNTNDFANDPHGNPVEVEPERSEPSQAFHRAETSTSSESADLVCQQ